MDSDGFWVTMYFLIILNRGCSFLSKSINAELHGSIAVVISDSDPDENRSFVDMIADGTEREEEVGIPAFFMLGKDG